MKPVSVIIPTHNRRGALLECLRALEGQDYPLNLLQIIVVPDRCTDGTEHAVRSGGWKEVLLVESKRPGQAAANNAGSAAATGEIVIFIDDEMRASPLFVASHVRAHDKREQTTVTGYSPVRLNENSTSVEHFVAKGYEAFHARLSDPYHIATPLDLNGGNFSIRRKDLREAGGFNESYLFQRNDFELAARLMERGFKFSYAPDALAEQVVQLTARAIVDRAVPRATNDLRLAREFPWCVRYLPFGRAFSSRSVELRWHLLWKVGISATAAFGLGRSLAPDSVPLMNWEYGARYITQLKHLLGSWTAFRKLVKRVDTC